MHRAPFASASRLFSLRGEWMHAIATRTCAAMLAGWVMVGMMAVGSGCQRSASSVIPVSGLEIAPDFGPTIDVDNFRGTVRIVADPRVKTPRVTAQVRSSNRRGPFKRDELVGKVDVRAESSIEEGRRMLRVTSAPAEGMPMGGGEPGSAGSEAAAQERISVDLEIRVARTEGIRVMNAGGPVELVRVEGPVTVLNGVGGAEGGNIHLRTGAPMTYPVTLTTSEGDVLYQVGPGSSGDFELLSDDGAAEFYAKIGKVTEVKPGVNRYSSVLNDGENPITLRTGRGVARVVVIENSATYGPDRWDGYPTWPKYPKPIGRLGGYHNDEPLFPRMRQRQPEN